jgi:hypothetical protein
MNTNTIQGSETNDINNIDRIIEILQNEIQNLKIKLEQEREEHRTIYSQIKKENNILKNDLGIK